ncbi:hypothetical protein [Allohahella marinimesophila]|uniref:Uncharacterized protein n=1 Tax=Allohahella marinimesophila TaxID=1054972 RepID=A0ABP7Q6Q3_9GAMM
MAEAEAASQQVARLVFKEILDGDRKKFLAKSNADAKAGGGARDLRFGSVDQVKDTLKQLFPETEQTKNKAGNAQFKGLFNWIDQSGRHQQETALLKPPYLKRSEFRIAQVHKYACFQVRPIPKASAGNRVLLLLIQRYDGSVWPHFVEEASLRTPDAWDESVSKPLLECLDAKRAKKVAAMGFIDLSNYKRFCNGKQCI